MNWKVFYRLMKRMTDAWNKLRFFDRGIYVFACITKVRIYQDKLLIENVCKREKMKATSYACDWWFIAMKHTNHMTTILLIISLVFIYSPNFPPHIIGSMKLIIIENYLERIWTQICFFFQSLYKSILLVSRKQSLQLVVKKSNHSAKTRFPQLTNKTQKSKAVEWENEWVEEWVSGRSPIFLYSFANVRINAWYEKACETELQKNFGFWSKVWA